ncbi:sensor histidine kinase [Nonomuraea spiralis]|uniref:sensor histidine kinase n=1 Tax=Nonomuraea TaxID=83681 RepID=UPI000F7950A5|nr:histidine kinase [Nonomuraea sp. WAC 01424]RSM97624.1 sensor histidine kinase [Nonomuraea sp. WAC 01424]
MRRPTRLDKVRWLIVYSTDFLLLVPATGFYNLYVLRETVGLPWQPLVAAGVLLLVFMALTTRPFRIAVRGGRRPTALLAVTGVLALVLTACTILYAIPAWLALLAPFVRRRTVVVASAAWVAALVLGVSLTLGMPLELLLVIVILAVFTVLCVGGVLANLWLWRMAKEAHEGQEARARLAVSEERLRFARDLNDLLGQSLADISTRTTGAARSLPDDPAAAERAMFEVRDLARRSLREVRAVVQNYRALDLDEVLSSVRAVLEAAEVRCTVRAETAALTPEVRTLLATVVREGATNVLKHSKAERCTITIENGVLEMSNDGVSGPAGEHAANGLAGLAQRVGAAGGVLRAEQTPGGGYLLRAAVPA